MLRPAAATEMAQIDALRAPTYARYNQQMADPPGCVWYVAADEAGNIGACAALGPSLEGAEGRSLIDLMGADTTALNLLFEGLIAFARRRGWGISCWMPIDRPGRIEYTRKHGFKPTAVLMHLPAVVEEEKAG